MVHLYVVVVTIALVLLPLRVGDRLKILMNVAAVLAVAAAAANHHVHVDLHLMDHLLSEVVDIARTHLV